MAKPVIRYYAATEQMDKKENQDFFFADPKSHLYLIADGMGGYEGGAFASRFASHLTSEVIRQVTSISNSLLEKTIQPDCDGEHAGEDFSELLQRIVRMINKELSDEAKLLGYDTMGSTLVFVLIRGGMAYVLNVGDSPCYRYSEDSLIQITRAHSKVDELVREGKISKEEARNHPESNIIRRWLGGKKDGAWADIHILPVYKNDRFFLCTDGVNKMIADDEIKSCLKLKNPKEAIDKILQAVKDTPHITRQLSKPVLKDNATAMVVDVIEVSGKVNCENGEFSKEESEITIEP